MTSSTNIHYLQHTQTLKFISFMLRNSLNLGSFVVASQFSHKLPQQPITNPMDDL